MPSSMKQPGAAMPSRSSGLLPAFIVAVGFGYVLGMLAPEWTSGAVFRQSMRASLALMIGASLYRMGQATAVKARRMGTQQHVDVAEIQEGVLPRTGEGSPTLARFQVLLIPIVVFQVLAACVWLLEASSLAFGLFVLAWLPVANSTLGWAAANNSQNEVGIESSCLDSEHLALRLVLVSLIPSAVVLFVAAVIASFGDGRFDREMVLDLLHALAEALVAGAVGWVLGFGLARKRETTEQRLAPLWLPVRAEQLSRWTLLTVNLGASARLAQIPLEQAIGVGSVGCLGVTLCAFVAKVGHRRCFGSDRDQGNITARDAGVIMRAATMRNTGMGMIAALSMPSEWGAVLGSLLIAATVSQHLVAALLIQRWTTTHQSGRSMLESPDR